MTDRMFADCCYGSDHQHLISDPCPQYANSSSAGDGYISYKFFRDLDREKAAAAAVARTVGDLMAKAEAHFPVGDNFPENGAGSAYGDRWRWLHAHYCGVSLAKDADA